MGNFSLHVIHAKFLWNHHIFFIVLIIQILNNKKKNRFIHEPTVKMFLYIFIVLKLHFKLRFNLDPCVTFT